MKCWTAEGYGVVWYGGCDIPDLRDSEVGFLSFL